MIAEVNRRLPPPERLPYFKGTWSRRRLALYEYRRLFPNGPLLRRERWLSAAMLGTWGMLVVLMGFPYPSVVWLIGFVSVLWWIQFRPDLRGKR